MGSIVVILLFSLSLIFCLLLKYSVINALIVGYIIFVTYGLIKGHDLKVLIKKSFEGVLTVKNILLVFILIGMITALWRASGTIAFIVYMGSKLISPSILTISSNSSPTSISRGWIAFLFSWNCFKNII